MAAAIRAMHRAICTGIGHHAVRAAESVWISLFVRQRKQSSVVDESIIFHSIHLVMYSGFCLPGNLSIASVC